MAESFSGRRLKLPCPPKSAWTGCASGASRSWQASPGRSPYCGRLQSGLQRCFGFQRVFIIASMCCSALALGWM
jgi:hypothetical protein